MLRILLGGADDFPSMFGALGRLAHRVGDLVESRCGLFEARGLLLGSPRQIIGRGDISFVPDLIATVFPDTTFIVSCSLPMAPLKSVLSFS